MSILKSMMTVSGLTLLSRITGLARETLMAGLFGASQYTDAFNVAFRIPNFLRRLFAEGAFSQAFVPILSDYQANKGQEKTQQMISAVASILFWVLLFVSLVGIICAPFIVKAFASGFTGEIFHITHQLTIIIFPYIFLISLVVLGASILNTQKKFGLAAAAPLLLNIAMIGAILLAPRFQMPIYIVGIGVLVGGVLQLLAILWGLRQINSLPRISLNLKAAYQHEGVQRVLQKMLPAIVAVSAAQISLLINTNYASHLVTGSVSWLSYADRLMEFPTALIGVAIGTVLMPTLSKDAAHGDLVQYNRTLDWGLRLMLTLTIPSMLGLLLIGDGLVAILFHYGRFTATDVSQTNLALSAYAIGILGLIAIKILAPGFYARQDVKTPMKISLAALLITQLSNLFFVPRLGHAGLAASISLGALFNAFTLLILLIKKHKFRPQPGWGLFLARIGIATCLLSAGLYWVHLNISWITLDKWLRLAYLAATLLTSGALYFGCLAALGLRIKRL